MNPEERESIKEMYGDFLKGLHIDPEFLSPFLEDDVFTENMIDRIQAKPTQAEKILQLLQILPRSGQNAFECFLSVLRMRSVWLADKLQRKYNEKMARSQQAINTLHNPTIEHESASHSADDESPDETDLNQESTLIHSANLSKTNSDASYYSPNVSLRSAGAVVIKYQHDLNHLYINLKNKLRKHDKREISFATPEPATFQMIEKLHDELFEKLTELQINMDQCSRALGSSPEVPLMSHIIKLKTTKTELEKQLKVSEESRNKYCEQIMKLDLKVRNLASELQINEEKLNRLTKTKVDQEMEYKHQIQILEDKLKIAEKKSADSDEATHVWQMNYLRVQKENEQLRREMYIYQPNYQNRTGAKENLNGILQISNQPKVNQSDRNEEEHNSASPGPAQTSESKIQTEGSQTRKGRLKQAKVQRRQRRYQDLSSLSYLSGSRIQTSNPDNKHTKEQMNVNKNNDNMSEIKQMKLSLQNAQNDETENQADNASRSFKLQVYIPSAYTSNDEEASGHTNSPTRKEPTPQPETQQEGRFKLQMPTVAMQKFDYESMEHQPRRVHTPQTCQKQLKLQIPMIMIQRDEKEQVGRTSPSRKSYKRQPLLKTLANQETEHGDGTKVKRKNASLH